MKVISVSGQSMKMHLCSGDILKVIECDSVYKIGRLYVLEGFEESSSKILVHRYIGNGIFKGDYNKNSDNEFYKQVKVNYQVEARIFKGRTISLKSAYTNQLSKILAYLSSKNRLYENRIDIFFVMLILAISFVLRTLENSLGFIRGEEWVM